MVLQVEIAVRKRAEETAQAANEAKGILMASVSFAARRMLSTAGWETVIPETLSKMGAAARVSRAFVAQVNSADPRLPAAVLHEWIEPSLGRGATRPPTPVWNGPEWMARAAGLRRGELVAFDIPPTSGAADVGAPKSAILAPIEVAGKLVRLPGIRRSPPRARMERSRAGWLPCRRRACWERP